MTMWMMDVAKRMTGGPNPNQDQEADVDDTFRSRQARGDEEEESIL